MLGYKGPARLPPAVGDTVNAARTGTAYNVTA